MSSTCGLRPAARSLLIAPDRPPGCDAQGPSGARAAGRGARRGAGGCGGARNGVRGGVIRRRVTVRVGSDTAQGDGAGWEYAAGLRPSARSKQPLRPSSAIIGQ
eukprot:1279914-Prymnesium_polylepis.1